ncbi:MAG TPA: hypothetical protein VF199_06185 [Bacillales bacterium]
MIRFKTNAFCLVSIFCLIGMLAFRTDHEAHAADHAYYTNTFPGYSLGAYSWFGYADVRCGMNSYVNYSAAASPQIDSIAIGYDAYNLSGTIQYSDYYQKPDTSGFARQTDIGVLGKSISVFDFKNNGYEWKTTQRIYNCGDPYHFAAKSDASQSKIPRKYRHVLDGNALENARTIIAEDYASDLKSYTVGNRPLNVRDFKLVKKTEKKGFNFADGTMKFRNSVVTDYSYVSISVPEKVKKDGKSYHIKAYVLVNNTHGVNDEVHTSLYIEPFKNK